MKAKKFLIPMTAVIAAVGISFATVEKEPKEIPVANDYIYNSGSWEAIPEQNCQQGAKTCRVQFGQGGPIFDVYDEMDLSTKKENITNDPTIL